MTFTLLQIHKEWHIEFFVRFGHNVLFLPLSYASEVNSLHYFSSRTEINIKYTLFSNSYLDVWIVQKLLVLKVELTSWVQIPANSVAFTFGEGKNAPLFQPAIG